MQDNSSPLKYKILPLPYFPYLFQPETLSVLFFPLYKGYLEHIPSFSIEAHIQTAQSTSSTQQIYFSEKERKPLSIKALYHGEAPSVPHLDILIALRCVKYLLTAECLRVKNRKFSSALAANSFGFYYTRKK